MILDKLWVILKNREAWHAAVPGVTKSQTWLSDWTRRLSRATLTSWVTTKTVLLSVYFHPFPHAVSSRSYSAPPTLISPPRTLESKSVFSTPALNSSTSGLSYLFIFRFHIQAHQGSSRTKMLLLQRETSLQKAAVLFFFHRDLSLCYIPIHEREVVLSSY